MVKSTTSDDSISHPCSEHPHLYHLDMSSDELSPSITPKSIGIFSHIAHPPLPQYPIVKICDQTWISSALPL